MFPFALPPSYQFARSQAAPSAALAGTHSSSLSAASLSAALGGGALATATAASGLSAARASHPNGSALPPQAQAVAPAVAPTPQKRKYNKSGAARATNNSPKKAAGSGDQQQQQQKQQPLLACAPLTEQSASSEVAEDQKPPTSSAGTCSTTAPLAISTGSANDASAFEQKVISNANANANTAAPSKHASPQKPSGGSARGKHARKEAVSLAASSDAGAGALGDEVDGECVRMGVSHEDDELDDLDGDEDADDDSDSLGHTPSASLSRAELDALDRELEHGGGGGDRDKIRRQANNARERYFQVPQAIALIVLLNKSTNLHLGFHPVYFHHSHFVRVVA